MAAFSRENARPRDERRAVGGRSEDAKPPGRSRSLEDSEHLMLRRLRDSDPCALDQLLERTWDSLVGYAERFVGSRDAAEDVAQDSFVRLWNGRKNWALEGSARAVLYRIARNLALDDRRKCAVHERRTASGFGLKPSRAPTPLELAEVAELRRALDTALAGLSDRDREIFVLSRFHGLSHAEIGEIVTLKPQTVANLLHRMVNSMRVQLSPFLLSDSDPKN